MGVTSLAMAANVTDTGPGQPGDVLYYTGPAGNDQGTWSSLPSLVQTIINNNTVTPATVGTSLNSGAVSTVGNIDVTGTGITQTVTGSGASGTSSYDFSNLSTVEGQTNAANLAAETSRATTAEAVNATAISNETARATSAEGALGSAIGAETGRATSAEASLGSAISAENVRASGAEAGWQRRGGFAAGGIYRH